jgi:hypothetical protein
MDRIQNIVAQIVPTWVKRIDGDGIEFIMFKFGDTVYNIYKTGYIVDNKGNILGVAQGVKELRELLKGV